MREIYLFWIGVALVLCLIGMSWGVYYGTLTDNTKETVTTLPEVCTGDIQDCLDGEYIGPNKKDCALDTCSEDTLLEAAPGMKTVPLDRLAERVTRKPFGILIMPATSPVQPERFTGYHTGTDFEALPDEEADTDIVVRAVCDGIVRMSRPVNGYGGVVVTSCILEGEAVAVIYGHVRLTSVAMRPGDRVSRGDEIAVLGTDGSAETDGERRHLHLGIRRGESINVAGYVSQETKLSEWLDPCRFIACVPKP